VNQLGGVRHSFATKPISKNAFEQQLYREQTQTIPAHRHSLRETTRFLSHHALLVLHSSLAPISTMHILALAERL
jgi:hypothetical protein